MLSCRPHPLHRQENQGWSEQEGWGLTVHVSQLGGEGRSDLGLCHHTTHTHTTHHTHLWSLKSSPQQGPQLPAGQAGGSSSAHSVQVSVLSTLPPGLPSWPGTSETRTPSLPPGLTCLTCRMRGGHAGVSKGLSSGEGLQGPFLPTQPCGHSPPPPHCSCSGKGISPP